MKVKLICKRCGMEYEISEVTYKAKLKQGKITPKCFRCRKNDFWRGGSFDA